MAMEGGIARPAAPAGHSLLAWGTDSIPYPAPCLGRTCFNEKTADTDMHYDDVLDWVYFTVRSGTRP